MRRYPLGQAGRVGRFRLTCPGNRIYGTPEAKEAAEVERIHDSRLWVGGMRRSDGLLSSDSRKATPRASQFCPSFEATCAARSFGHVRHEPRSMRSRVNGMTDGQGPSAPPSGMAQQAFLDKAYTAASEWARFADPKVLGVFVFLGLGAANLVSRAAQLWSAGDEGTWGFVAAAAFLGGCVAAGITVLFATFVLFPKLQPGGKKPPERQESLFYFGDVARFHNAKAYAAEVREQSADALLDDLAGQVWAVSEVAANKHYWAQRSYLTAVVFLGCRALARVALSFA